MKTRALSSIVSALWCIIVLPEAQGQSTAFTYNGQLADNGSPASGNYDLRFAIFNAATSTDVIGGNSGGPLLDRNGDVVGAVFDGNIHLLGGEYFYDGALNRSVTVPSTLMRAALADVYGLSGLLAELEGH
jgi:S1-C subfamily serine protease